ncbi:FAD-binding protein [Micromonospora sp. NPDC007271]|uniref:FAD-dependent oxidoreductase n=1 Tax=Micromonospora sp. NPDC007271 TaxID=3154587 RepID=UPI0034032668
MPRIECLNLGPQCVSLRLPLAVVERDAGTATVGGGAHIGDLSGAGQQHGLATPTGTVRTVGMAGLTLAGGYGPLCGRYGLAVDNLLRADVVLADGRLVTASPDGDAELFWALRGGGGNFGVVTSLMYRLHELPTVLSGMMLFPFAQAATVLTGYREIVATAADEATIMAGFLPNPDGPPLVFLCPMWSGADLAEGERLIAGLERLGNPVMSQIAATPYHDALSMFDGAMRVPPSYGPNYERLASAKCRYDPDNIFASAVPALAV